MKGLLVKDFYVTIKTQYAFFFISAVFLIFSIENKNPFFLMYPTLICGLIPGNLIAYDERIKWHIFSDTFPYSRKQMVSAKYILGLLIFAALLVLSALVPIVAGVITGQINWGEILNRLLFLPAVALVPMSVALPALFKFGAEKGRIATYIMIGAIVGIFVLLNLLEVPFGIGLSGDWIIIGELVLVGVIYALSWFISIKFYEKRDF